MTTSEDKTQVKVRKKHDHIKEEREHQGQDLSRILSLSDSVIAVGITLLVLNIVMPATTDRLSLADQLYHKTLPGALAFLYSYVIVADLWISHHRIFHFIKRYDGRLIGLNLLFLATIVSLPIPIYLFAQLGNMFVTWAFYATTEAVAGLLLLLIWLHGTYHHRLVDEQLDPRIIRYHGLRLLMLPLTFLLSIPLALLNVLAAEISLIVVTLLYGILRRIYGKRIASPSRGWSVDRLLILSDAMIAVSMTLLIAKIQLSFPSGNALDVLAFILPQLWVYMLSFTIVALYWASHHRIFQFIIKEDGRLVYLNFIFLFFIELLPIPNLLYANFGAQPLAIIIYALAQFLMGLMILLIWLYASGRHRLIEQDLSRQEIRRQATRSFIPPLIFLFSSGVALIGSQYALYFWLLVIVVQGAYLRVKHGKLHAKGERDAVSMAALAGSTEDPAIWDNT